MTFKKILLLVVVLFVLVFIGFRVYNSNNFLEDLYIEAQDIVLEKQELIKEEKNKNRKEEKYLFGNKIRYFDPSYDYNSIYDFESFFSNDIKNTTNKYVGSTKIDYTINVFKDYNNIQVERCIDMDCRIEDFSYAKFQQEDINFPNVFGSNMKDGLKAIFIENLEFDLNRSIVSYNDDDIKEIKFSILDGHIYDEDNEIITKGSFLKKIFRDEEEDTLCKYGIHGIEELDIFRDEQVKQFHTDRVCFDGLWMGNVAGNYPVIEKNTENYKLIKDLVIYCYASDKTLCNLYDDKVMELGLEHPNVFNQKITKEKYLEALKKGFCENGFCYANINGTNIMTNEDDFLLRNIAELKEHYHKYDKLNNRVSFVSYTDRTEEHIICETYTGILLLKKCNLDNEDGKNVKEKTDELNELIKNIQNKS